MEGYVLLVGGGQDTERRLRRQTRGLHVAHIRKMGDAAIVLGTVPNLKGIVVANESGVPDYLFAHWCEEIANGIRGQNVRVAFLREEDLVRLGSVFTNAEVDVDADIDQLVAEIKATMG